MYVYAHVYNYVYKYMYTVYMGRSLSEGAKGLRAAKTQH